MSDSDTTVPSQRRLQRPPDFTGGQLDTFRAVVLRHGVPGALLGAICFVLPLALVKFRTGLTPAFEDPGRYLVACLVIFALLVIYASVIDRRFQPMQVVWIIYLGLVSLWEEWVFRIALPYSFSGDAFVVAVVISNVLFGAMHYFTLRWRWFWCVGAALGGLALSRQYIQHGDFLMLVGLHWVATYINTPRYPGLKRALLGK